MKQCIKFLHKRIFAKDMNCLVNCEEEKSFKALHGRQLSL